MGSLPTADAIDIDNIQIPSVIAIGDVARVLYYICPPSALQPLPNHLLSVPLLQRHHFLAISTQDPLAYLTWPGDSDSDSERVLALLEDIRPEDWPPDGLNVHIRYATDPDAVYAHVRFDSIPAFHSDIQSSVRLIFLWDQPSNSWKYHNCALGDFPKRTYSNLSHPMALFPDNFLPEHTQSLSIDNPDDDDVYWNAYEASEQSLQSIPVKPVPRADTEDAYWAQYASVQGQCAPESSPDLHTNQIHLLGSADSTMPSPRSHNRRLQLAEGDQRIFVPSSKLNPDLPQFDLYNPLAPPSPSSLSRRLALLPIRPDPPLQDEDDPSSVFASVASPSHHADLVGAEEPSTVLLRPVVQSAEAISIFADEALKNTIQGLYQLWRTGKKSRQDFLTLVERAIEEQS